MDGSRLIPQQSDNNVNGYSPSSITASSDPLSLNRHEVIGEDDIYRYADEETTAFRFTESFLHVDMKHILAKSASRKDPRLLFLSIRFIQEHSNGIWPISG